MPGPTIVLVHGAFADASGFAGSDPRARASGAAHTALAPPNPLRGVAFDASVVSDVVKAIDGPVVLVRTFLRRRRDHPGVHAALENVTGLVFLAAFGLEVGESCASGAAAVPAAPCSLEDGRPDPLRRRPAPRAVLDLYASRRTGSGRTFCADVPVDMADVMFATQRARSRRAAAQRERHRGGLEDQKPSWFLVSEHDNAISPDAERFMAQRMGATTDTIDGSHTAFIAKPVAVATFHPPGAAVTS